MKVLLLNGSPRKAGCTYTALTVVAEALEKLGHTVDRKLIYLKDAVKEVGSYKATIKFHKEVSVEIPFEVVSE